MAKDNRENYQKPEHFNIKPEQYIASEIAKKAIMDYEFSSALLRILESYSIELYNYYNDFLHIVYDAKITKAKYATTDLKIKNTLQPMITELKNIQTFFKQLVDDTDFQITEILIKGNKNKSLKIKNEIWVQKSISGLLDVLLSQNIDLHNKWFEAQAKLKADNLVNAFRKSSALAFLNFILSIELFPIDEGKRASNLIYNLIADLLELADLLDKDKITSNPSDYVVSLLR